MSFCREPKEAITKISFLQKCGKIQKRLYMQKGSPSAKIHSFCQISDQNFGREFTKMPAEIVYFCPKRAYRSFGQPLLYRLLPKKGPLFKFPALAVAWQTGRPLHSQSAKKELISLNLRNFFYSTLYCFQVCVSLAEQAGIVPRLIA